MSLDVRITCSAALAGRAQPRGAVTNQRRRRSSAAAVCSVMSIHVALRGMVALWAVGEHRCLRRRERKKRRLNRSLWTETAQQRIAICTARRVTQYLRSELGRAVEPERSGFCDDGSRRSSRQDAHLLPLSTSVFQNQSAKPTTAADRWLAHWPHFVGSAAERMHRRDRSRSTPSCEAAPQSKTTMHNS